MFRVYKTSCHRFAEDTNTTVSGANRTTTTMPAMTNATQARFFIVKGSFKMKVVMSTLVTTPMDPMGVTIDAGANPYAIKLPNSPKMIPLMPTHHQGDGGEVLYRLARVRVRVLHVRPLH